MGTAPQTSPPCPVPPLSLVLTGLVPRPDRGGRPLLVHGRLPGDEPHRQGRSGLREPEARRAQDPERVHLPTPQGGLSDQVSSCSVVMKEISALASSIWRVRLHFRGSRLVGSLAQGPEQGVGEEGCVHRRCRLGCWQGWVRGAEAGERRWRPGWGVARPSRLRADTWGSADPRR